MTIAITCDKCGVLLTVGSDEKCPYCGRPIQTILDAIQKIEEEKEK